MIGSVYVFSSGLFTKVGRAGDVRRRFKEIKTANPAVYSHYEGPKTDLVVAIESCTHRKLDAYRADGEWFYVDAAEAKSAVEGCYQHPARILLLENHKVDFDHMAESKAQELYNRTYNKDLGKFNPIRWKRV